MEQLFYMSSPVAATMTMADLVEHSHDARKAQFKLCNHCYKVADEEQQWLYLSAAIIKCRRLLFSLITACRLSIYQSQDDNSDQIVYHYHKNQKQQLVNVAHSRPASLKGLFLTNVPNQFQFYHAHGSIASSIKDVQDLGLSYHYNDNGQQATT